MLGIYLSGTGNTEHCITKLLGLIDPEAEIIRMTKADEEKIIGKIRGNDTIVLAYPTQFSNVPYMVRDFIKRNKNVWSGKKVLCMTTMGAFSGDGAGCSARLLKGYGAEIIGGLQIRMPVHDQACNTLSPDRQENHIHVFPYRICPTYPVVFLYIVPFYSITTPSSSPAGVDSSEVEMAAMPSEKVSPAGRITSTP